MRRAFRILAALAFLTGLGWGQAHAQLTLTGAGCVVKCSSGGGGGSAPTLDGFAHNIGATVTLTTTKTNDVIVILASSENNAVTPTISSVSDTAGLTWARRGSKVTATSGSQQSSQEIWWAFSSGALSGDVITVNFVGGADLLALVAFGVNGSGSSSAPWDVNVSLPATATSAVTGTPSVSGVSTTHANAILLGFYSQGNTGAFTAQTSGSGFSIIDQTGSNAGSFSIAAAAESQGVTSAQSSVSVAFGTSSTAPWSIIADAIAGP